jgi:hypothetical protein
MIAILARTNGGNIQMPSVMDMNHPMDLSCMGADLGYNMITNFVCFSERFH